LPEIARIICLIGTYADSFQLHPVRDLVGLDEDRLGFRSGGVGWVLEEVSGRDVVQVEESEAADDPQWDGRWLRAQ
jgi:hypothetical protein